MSIKSSKVVRSNDLIRATHQLKLSEQKLLLLVLVNVQSDQREYSVKATDYSKAYGVVKQAAYEALKEAGESLFNQSLWVKENTGQRQMRWCSSVFYSKEDNKISLRFTEEIMPLLVGLKERFTIITLDQIKNFRSAHALRLYEWCKSHQSQGGFTITVEDFRARLSLSPDYRQDNIQSRIIKPAVLQINKTDLQVSVLPNKDGVRVVAYDFKISARNKEQPVKQKPDNRSEVHSTPPSFKLY